ncbi:winged helix DNA-binding domain-containing protein [Spirosoma taeanense]|uniref:Winged helix DNA-binding domain-containing protein n=1 Tax=Spirosoma taeanense TaxID=2735870 RepID=A0A6M5Y9H1_9BACT|nr:winged helix DNA-binding domain-containing protein [Spirosoma taeanense]QJW90908.1 winged helix DNA-binding domain-containing protein [Spirosoma taeanense]
MITATQVATQRLISQQLVNASCPSAARVVQWMGAMQAQDYDMARWAIGIRLPGSTETLVEDALDRGDILRTHLLRPTWHFVAATDIHWLLALTAPQVKKCMTSMNRKLELDERVFRKSNAVIEKALEGHTYLTREELMTRLQEVGIQTDGIRSAHIMMNAELDGVVCNGPRREYDRRGYDRREYDRRAKQFTYALLPERVPIRQSLSREEALAELARRYFTSHGPATLKDFAWWSGLNATDVKQAIEGAKPYLHSMPADTQTYWLGATFAGPESVSEQIHFLPAFDEFMVSYCDRTASLQPEFARQTNTGNGIFYPIIVVNGQVVGVWKRTVKPKELAMALTFFYPLPDDLTERIREKANLYATYTQCKQFVIT